MAKRKQDKVRVLRVVEYVGDRNAVESEVTRAIHGERVIEGRDGTVLIKAATLGLYPDILSPEENRQLSLDLEANGDI